MALLARDESGQHRADTAAKLSRVLTLEKELAGVREEAEVGAEVAYGVVGTGCPCAVDKGTCGDRYRSRQAHLPVHLAPALRLACVWL